MSIHAEKNTKQIRSKTGFDSVHLLHDNAPVTRHQLYSRFLSRKNKLPPNSTDLAPCDILDIDPEIRRGLRFTQF